MSERLHRVCSLHDLKAPWASLRLAQFGTASPLKEFRLVVLKRRVYPSILKTFWSVPWLQNLQRLYAWRDVCQSCSVRNLMAPCLLGTLDGYVGIATVPPLKEYICSLCHYKPVMVYYHKAQLKKLYCPFKPVCAIILWFGSACASPEATGIFKGSVPVKGVLNSFCIKVDRFSFDLNA